MRRRGKRSTETLPPQALAAEPSATIQLDPVEAIHGGAESPEDEHARLRQLVNLHQRDRQLLAYEIHDGLTQYMTGAAWQFEAFRNLQRRDPEGAWQMFEAGLKLLHRSMEESRRLINGLRPATLHHDGLVAAIEQLIEESDDQGGPAITFTGRLSKARLPVPLESSIYCVVQECLTNARRHSQSPRVRVRLLERGDRIRVEVQDWGVGFASHDAGAGRFGLSGIHQRAEAFGGRASIHSAPGRGTRVVVEFPRTGGAAAASW
jgi:signal transduction histidine kinase